MVEPNPPDPSIELDGQLSLDDVEALLDDLDADPTAATTGGE